MIPTDPADVLALCRARDVTLSVEDGRLRVSAPRGAVDDGLRQMMRAHKDGLITLLGERPEPDAGETIPRLADRRAPLSPWQRGLWLIHERADGDLATLHATAVFRISGALDAAALGRALDELAKRHEALRLRFATTEAHGVMQVASEDGPRLAVSTIAGDAQDMELDAEAERLARELGSRRFDLSAEPPCRVRLVSAGASRHRLVFVGHHLVIDGWSVTVFLRELLTLHRRIACGEDAELPELPVQYLDCAARFAERASDPESMAKARRRGRELADLPSRHGFATDHRRDAAERSPDRVTFKLTREIADRLRDTARAARGSLFATLLAVLQHVHRRVSGAEALSVMTPVANRALDPRVEPLIGCFANAVILAPVVDADADLQQATAAVAAAALDVFEDQSLPFDEALAQSGLPRVAGAETGAQVFFALQDAAQLPDVEGLSIGVQSLPFAFGRHDLSVEFRVARDGGLACSLHFRRPLFSRETVTAIAEAYRAILEKAARSPREPLARLPFGTTMAEGPATDGGACASPDPAVLRRRAAAAAVERLGLPPGTEVTIDLASASDEAQELVAQLAAQGFVLRSVESGASAPIDVLLTTRPTGRNARRTIAYNHVDAEHEAVLGTPRHGLLAVARAPAPGERFRAAQALIPGLCAVDHFAAALPAGLSGRLALAGAGSTEPIGGVARLSDAGELQIGDDAALAGGGWINGRFVDFDFCGEVLANLRGVADAALATVQGATGAELVAWIAPSEAGDPKRLPAAVSSALIERASVDHVVRLRRLPRDRHGRVDRGRLAATPVVSTSVAERAARAAGLDAGFERAFDRPAPRLAHVSDLVPDNSGGLRVRPVFAQAEIALARRGEAAVERAARLDGGPLDESYPDAGWSPVDWLRAAARADRLLRTVEPDGGEDAISYASLLSRALRIAGGLRARGFGPGSMILLSARSPQAFLAGFFGAMAAGVATAPILPPRVWIEGDATVARFGHVAALSKAAAILSDEATPVGTLLPGALTPLLTSDLERDEEAGEDFRWRAGDIAIFTFTSGSTGAPKGVPLSARNIWATPAGFGPRFGFAPGEVCLNFTPLDHVASLIGFCGSALRAGGQLAVAPVDRFLAEPERMAERLGAWRVARSWAPDFAWGMIAEGLAGRPAGAVDLSALRAVFSAGECPLDSTFARLARALARHGRSDVLLQASWGMSETTSLVTLSQAWNGGSANLVRFGVIDNGGPVPGTAVRIVDGRGEILSEGEMGQFQVRGPSVFRGYVTLGEPEAAVDDEGWLSTGDLALIESGRIMICGRAKEVLILNGQNVAQVEVEDRVNAIDGVAPSFSVAITCRDQRDGRETLIVFFSPAAEVAHPDRLAATIRRIAGVVAAGFGVRPDYVLPLPKADIPKTGLGKLQRTQLRKRFEAGAFDALVRRIDLLLANERAVPRRLAVWGEATVVASAVDPAAAGRVVVLDDGSDTAHRLAAAIERRGAASRLVRPDDVEAAIRACDDALVIDVAMGDGDAASLVTRRLERALAWSRAADNGRLRIVWLDDEPLGDVALAFAAAIEREIPNATGRSLLLGATPSGPAIETAARLALTAPRARPQIRIAPSGAASVMRLREADLSDIARGDGAPPAAGARVLVAGGLGEVGAALLPQLLAWTDWRFAIVGRREPAAVAPQLERIGKGAAGGRLSYHRLDAGDANALADLVRRERVAAALNLTGRVARTPVADLGQGDVEALSAERIRVANALDRAFATAGGVVVHLTSVLASFASRDFLAYGVANAAHRQWIAGRSSGPVRHVELCCSQWRPVDRTDPLQGHLDHLGYGMIDGRLGAAGVIAAFTSSLRSFVLGLDLDGPDIAPRADGRSAPMDRIRAAGGGRALTDRDWAALRAGTAPYGFEPEPADAQDGGAALGTEVERRIAGLWGELLGSDAPIRADTNFFDIGGTSLLAARLHARLRDMFAKPDNVVELFAHPTPRSQARLVTGAGPAGRSAPATRPAAAASRMADRRRSARRASLQEVRS